MGGHVVDETRLLWQVPDALADGDALVNDVVPKERPVSRYGAAQAEQDLHQGGFPSPVRTEETEDRMAWHA